MEGGVEAIGWPAATAVEAAAGGSRAAVQAAGEAEGEAVEAVRVEAVRVEAVRARAQAVAAAREEGWEGSGGPPGTHYCRSEC